MIIDNLTVQLLSFEIDHGQYRSHYIIRYRYDWELFEVYQVIHNLLAIWQKGEGILWFRHKITLHPFDRLCEIDTVYENK